jgi:hypothetical protein
MPALEYDTMKVQEIRVGLKLNGTEHRLGYADDVNLLGVNKDAIKKNSETVMDNGRSLVWN